MTRLRRDSGTRTGRASDLGEERDEDGDSRPQPESERRRRAAGPEAVAGPAGRQRPAWMGQHLGTPS